MICQNCDLPISPSDERCPNCGAKPLHRRVIFGEKREEFTLKPEDESSEFDLDVESSEPWQSLPKRAPTEPDGARRARAAEPQVRWGGFFRRGVAFAIDFVVVVALSTALLLLSYIGYKVGLSAHDQALTMANARPLLFFATLGWIALAAGYFVLLHGLDGKTIGKWSLGLRVVGPEQAPISYRQAFVRWIGTIAFTPLILGVLWIIWSREKRAWHDLLARTWVIRD